MTADRRAARGCAVLAGTVVLAATLPACSSSAPAHPVPSFHPGAGRFRVVAHPTSGAPAPQLITFRGHRLLAGLGVVTGSGDGAKAQLVFAVQHTAARVASREYRRGDTVQVGPVHVRIDGVYGSGEQHGAVDISLT